MSIEITQQELEQAELAALKARRRFLTALSAYPELMELYSACHRYDRLAIDARRARRESEIHEKGGEE